MTERQFVPEEAVGLLSSGPSGLDRDGLHNFLKVTARVKGWIDGLEFSAIQMLDALPKDPSSPANDTAGDVARDQNLGPGQAKRKTETAQQMKDLPETETALGNGDISGQHAEARRMACESGIIPLVLDGDSLPLDLGRTKRLRTPGQHLALGALWATCSIADCTVPFEWMQIHHVDPFETGGRTDVGRLTPACDHCHDLAHSPGWSIDKLPDGTVVTVAPDGSTWRRRPNRQPEPHPAAASTKPASPAAETLFTHAA